MAVGDQATSTAELDWQLSVTRNRHQKHPLLVEQDWPLVAPGCTAALLITCIKRHLHSAALRGHQADNLYWTAALRLAY
jgi:hypothetical protein